MRDKEKLLDYRFMPEPNLPPLHVYSKDCLPSSTPHDSLVVLEKVAGCLTELPAEVRERVQQKYGIPHLSASLLVVSIPPLLPLVGLSFVAGCFVPNGHFASVLICFLV